jgi:hypothetical protein
LQLAAQIERDGWDRSVLTAVEQAARDADQESADELDAHAKALSGCSSGNNAIQNLIR